MTDNAAKDVAHTAWVEVVIQNHLVAWERMCESLDGWGD